MPCDQNLYQSIEWPKADLDVLSSALVRAGFELTHYIKERGYIQFRDRALNYGTFSAGAFRIPEDMKIDSIKAEYAKEAVERVAKKLNWQVKKTATNKYVISRRAY